MKTILLSLTGLAVAFAGLTFTPATAEAAPRAHEVRFHHGYRHARYLHRGYRGWSRTYWNTRYGCTFYQCPTDNQYYYWYAPSNCYLPASQINTYRPVLSSAPAVAVPVTP